MKRKVCFVLAIWMVLMCVVSCGKTAEPDMTTGLTRAENSDSEVKTVPGIKTVSDRETNPEAASLPEVAEECAAVAFEDAKNLFFDHYRELEGSRLITSEARCLRDAKRLEYEDDEFHMYLKDMYGVYDMDSYLDRFRDYFDNWFKTNYGDNIEYTLSGIDSAKVYTEEELETLKKENGDEWKEYYIDPDGITEAVSVNFTVTYSHPGFSQEINYTALAVKYNGEWKIADSNAFPSGPVTCGGYRPYCPVHSDEYHLIYPEDFGITIKTWRYWRWEMEALDEAAVDPETGVDENGCSHPNQTLKNFIDYMGLTWEQVNEASLSSPSGKGGYAINVGLLMSDDLEAIDAYYRDKEARDHSISVQQYLRWLQSDIAYYLEINSPYEPRISMAEFVRKYDVPREDFEHCLNTWKEKYKRDLGSMSFNVDAIYGEDAIDPYAEVNGRRLNWVELDSIFCGVDDIRIN